MKKGLTSIVGMSLLTLSQAYAVEYKVQGVIDARAISTDSVDSYLSGGRGKFATSDGQQLALSQFGTEFSLIWESGISAHLVSNAYLDQEDSVIGITEGYLKYRGLPSDNGLRWQGRIGMLYPKISLENDATAWASKYTLNSSTLNTWIGEEIRVLGTELEVSRLGRVHGKSYDLSFSTTLFANNDPAGALLSWHGWTTSSRQTVWTEKRQFPQLPAQRVGGALAGQAVNSDPFTEVDDRLGYHIRGEWKLRRKGQVSIGFYDNRATPYIDDNGQYGWRTRFAHIEGKWLFDNGIVLFGQLLKGSTLMQSDVKTDVVNNDYYNGYLAATKRWNKHRFTMRLEKFAVIDNDKTKGDNNNERGHAATFNYTYRLARPLFFSTEYSWIKSDRMSRSYQGDPINLTEKQLQFALRYFF